jgi:hypothetical protein
MALMKLKFLVIFWMTAVVVIWIALSFILASFAVVAIIFEEIFIQNLTNILVIISALILETMATIGFYYTQSIEWTAAENLSRI